MALTITIGADASQLRAQLAVAQSEMRATTRELNSLANTARRAGDDLSFAKVGQAASHFNAVTGEVARLRQQIEGLHAPSRSLAETLNHSFGQISAKVREPLDALAMMRSGLRQTVKVAGAAFAVREIAEFAEKMGELGEKTRNTAFILGLSVKEVGELSGVATLAGRDLDTMQRTVERLGRSVQQALVDGNSKAATSFRNIGVSIAEVEAHSHDLIGLLRLIVERAAELEPGLPRTGELYELLGRSIDRLVPLMSRGAGGFDELRQKAADYARSLRDNEPQMLAQAEATNRLSTDLKTLANDGFGFIAPVIRAATAVFDFFVQGIDRAIGSISAFLGMADAALRFAERARVLPDLSNPPTGEGEPAAGTRPVGTERGGARGGAAGATRMADWLAQHGYSPTAAAAIMGNAQVESGFDTGASNASGHFGLFQWDKTRQQPLGGSTDFNKQMELMDAELQKLDAGFKNSGDSAGALARRFDSVFERSGGSLLAQRVAGAQGFEAETTKAGERAANETYQGQTVAYRHSLSDQARAAFEHYETIKRLAGEGSAPELTAKRELTTKLAQFYDQDTRQMIDALKAQQAAAIEITEKIKIQRQIIATTEARGNAPLGGGVDQGRLAAEKTELATLQRGVGAQSYREAERDAAAMQRIDALKLSGFKAIEGQKVAMHQITAAAAIAAEANYAGELALSEKQILDTTVATAAKTTEERQKAFEQSLQWAAKTNAAQEQFLKLQADQARAEAAKYAAPFIQAFDQIGSSFERSFGQLLMRQTTCAKAWQQIYQTAVSSILTMVESVGSKAAAGPLAKLLGMGQAAAGAGIGDVLGSWVGKQLFGAVGDVAHDTALLANTTALGVLTAALGGAAASSIAAAGAATSAAGSVAGGGISAAGRIGGGGGVS